MYWMAQNRKEKIPFQFDFIGTTYERYVLHFHIMRTNEEVVGDDNKAFRRLINKSKYVENERVFF